MGKTESYLSLTSNIYHCVYFGLCGLSGKIHVVSSMSFSVTEDKPIRFLMVEATKNMI